LYLPVPVLVPVPGQSHDIAIQVKYLQGYSTNNRGSGGVGASGKTLHDNDDNVQDVFSPEQGNDYKRVSNGHRDSDDKE